MLNAAANGPTRLGLRARVSGAFIIKPHGIPDTAEGHTCGHVGHGVTHRHPEAAAHRAEPPYLARIGAIRRLRREVSRGPATQPGDVALKAKHEVAVLPVVSDLPATDEPCLRE